MWFQTKVENNLASSDLKAIIGYDVFAWKTQSWVQFPGVSLATLGKLKISCFGKVEILILAKYSTFQLALQ